LIGKTNNQLYLAAGDTTDAHLQFNALPFNSVREAIRDSGAAKKILILDCCFSGRALNPMGTEDSILRSNLDIADTYALASAPANQVAIASRDKKHTAFTSELLRILSEGLDTGRPGITLQEIYETIRSELRKKPELPVCQATNFQDAWKIVFARNRSFRQGDGIPQVEISELPRELSQALESSFAGIREGAVIELARLLVGADRSAALGAFKSLEFMIDDDSRRVSAAASQILDSYDRPEGLPAEPIQLAAPMRQSFLEEQRDKNEKGEEDYTVRRTESRPLRHPTCDSSLRNWLSITETSHL